MITDTPGPQAGRTGFFTWTSPNHYIISNCLASLFRETALGGVRFIVICVAYAAVQADSDVADADSKDSLHIKFM